MSLKDKLFGWYDDGGARTESDLIGLWEYIFWHSPLETPLRSILGDCYHEKLGRGPNLGYWPQIREPRSFNEKILHLKLFTDNELYTKVADKWEVREYVEEKVGDEILNEVYHVTDDPDTIPFEELPDKYAVKATHGSGWNILVEDEDEEDFEEMRSRCREWLTKDLSVLYKEYWYSDIKPRILVERYIEDPERESPLLFRIFVFNGEAKYILLTYESHSDSTETRIRFYDTDWNAYEHKYVTATPIGPDIDEPEQLDEMLDIAEELGSDFDFVSVDLYAPTPDEIVFGELTLSPFAGGARFDPIDFDFELGSYWDGEFET